MQLCSVQVTGRRWLTEHTFELRLSKPSGFDYLPGQKIGFVEGGLQRDYSLLGPAHSPELAICVRYVENGRFSPRLAQAAVGERFHITPAFGFFVYTPSARQAVMVATGTGIAPFVAFVRSGVKGFDLLHGVRAAGELYYGAELAAAARTYVPCISGPDASAGGEGVFAGRVTTFLAERFDHKACDFYLCGRGDMVRDATHLIDRRFTGAYVFSEIFF